jgi:predicted nucleic acid-binding protein
VPERRHARGIVDTSVLIDPPPESALPEEASIAAITLAELAAGVHATRDPNERAARHDRLQRVEATLEALPFDAGAARAYGRVFAAISGAGRKARGKRAIDLLIAATALSVGLPLFTRNVGDFSGLEGVVEIVEIRA